MLKVIGTPELGLHLVTTMDLRIYKKFMKLMSRCGVDLAAYSSTHKLYVLDDPKKKELELLTNHHIYMLMMELGQTEFTVETVHTAEEADKYLSIDRVNAMIMCNALEATKKDQSNKDQSNSAAIHQRRRVAGQICPLCGGPLELKKERNHCGYTPTDISISPGLGII